MQIVRARLQTHIHHAAHRSAKLGRIGVGLHLELLNRVDGRLHHLAAPLRARQIRRVVVDAIDHEVVLRHAHAAGTEAAITAAAGRLHRATGKQRQLAVVTAIERHVDNAPVLNHLPLARLDGIEAHSVGGHLHFLRSRADLKRKVELGALVHFERDPRTCNWPKALLLDVQPVSPRRQQRHGVVAIGVRLRGPRNVGGGVSDGDAGGRHYGTRAIRYAAGDLGRLGMESHAGANESGCGNPGDVHLGILPQRVISGRRDATRGGSRRRGCGRRRRESIGGGWVGCRWG